VKAVRWTPHALDNLLDREIDREIAELTLTNPELIAPNQPQRSLLMRRYFDQVLQQEMLLIIVVEDTDLERVVITVFKTSQLKKYLKELRL
jgi:nitrogen regulatory protein PII